MTTWIDDKGRRRGAQNIESLDSPHARRRAHRVLKNSRWIAELLTAGSIMPCEVSLLAASGSDKDACRAIAERIGCSLHALRTAARDARNNEDFEADTAPKREAD